MITGNESLIEYQCALDLWYGRYTMRWQNAVGDDDRREALDLICRAIKAEYTRAQYCLDLRYCASVLAPAV